jgi:hypothetical protein
VGRRFRFARGLVAVAAAAAMLLALMPAAVYAEDPADVMLSPKEIGADEDGAPPPSESQDTRDVEIGNAITECPQAGSGLDKQPKPLDRREIDAVEKLSQGGDDGRGNQDYACFPQDETSIAVNPTNQKNAIAGANDYRLGWGSSGFYVTTDGGNHWYDGIKPFPTNANQARDHIDGGGDPAVAFDRGGTAYYNDLHFMRENDESGIFVARSTNGGFTWSRPCVPAGTDATARCGGNGDVRRPGDGVVAYTPDNDNTLNGSVPAHDKNYMTTGPRPAGVTAVCFAPITKTAIPAGQPGCATDLIGPDRLYVTWTIFFGNTAIINFSFSDDRAYSWSPPRAISGSAPFCQFGVANNCDSNQFSVPTVNPTTGGLWVAFENFNTPDENQYLVVRSTDGGGTFTGPFFVSVVFDVNYPRSGQNRTDCTTRGQGGRAVLTNSCFRVNSGGNIVADRRGGDFADDLYLVFSDNRNGSRQSSNVDVFLFTSKDGGATWIGPTRVNDDPSRPPDVATEGGRDCGRIVGRVCPTNAPNFGNDNWWPWIDISDRGDLNVVLYDRRLDTNSTVGEWPDSRAAPNGRAGNYLVWNFGAQCSITTTATVTQTSTSIPAAARQCLGNEAAIVPQPTAPPNPASGAVVPGGAQTVFPFRNFNVSDTASNWDYTFRAGIFAGDYNNVTVDHQGQAWAFWTDARNGRSARQQAGRNPICEQSDVFVDRYSATSGGGVKTSATQGMNLYLQTDCPLAMQEKGARAP